MRSHRLFAALLLVGCAPAAPTSPPFASGTRLRAVAWDGGDGALAFVGFHDTELDVDCAFTLADDGVMRCMPARGWLAFADSSCSGSMYYVATDGPCGVEAAPRYVGGAGPRATTCSDSDTTTTAYRVGDRLSERMAWFDDGASCSAYTVSFCPYPLEAVPASTFVGATLRREPLGDSVAQEVLVADDGAVLVSGLRDTARDAPCAAIPQDTYVRFAEPLLERCVPSAVTHSFDDEHLDSTCTGETATTLSACAPARAVVEWQSADCGYDLSFSEIGEPVETTYQLIGEPPVCTASTTDPSYVHAAIGAGIDPSSLPRLPPRSGTGRLRAEADGRLAARFFDTELDVVCAPTDFADGSTRCAPYTRATSTWAFFEDPECTAPIAEFAYLCGRTPTFAPVPGPGGLRAIHRVGDAVPAPATIYYRDASRSCVALSADPMKTYWRLEEAVELAELTRVTL